MPVTPGWIAAVEVMPNRGIRSSTEASVLAHRLDGTALRVDIEGLSSIRTSVTGGRLACSSVDRPREPVAPDRVDAIIEGSSFALLQLAMGSRSAGTLIRGDAEIANSYRQLFTVARPDMEEELSRLVGDLPARRLAMLAHQAVAWVGKAHRTLGENIAEYLQEESRDLVSAPELEEFLQGVDAARETLDRVDARLSRIEQRLARRS